MRNNDWAFPVHADTIERCGLTKRELFAAMAMQGFVSNQYLMQNVVRMHSEGKVKDQSIAISEQAVELADALINALNDQK